MRSNKNIAPFSKWGRRSFDMTAQDFSEYKIGNAAYYDAILQSFNDGTNVPLSLGECVSKASYFDLNPDKVVIAVVIKAIQRPLIGDNDWRSSGDRRMGRDDRCWKFHGSCLVTRRRSNCESIHFCTGSFAKDPESQCFMRIWLEKPEKYFG